MSGEFSFMPTGRGSLWQIQPLCWQTEQKAGITRCFSLVLRVGMALSSFLPMPESWERAVVEEGTREVLS